MIAKDGKFSILTKLPKLPKLSIIATGSACSMVRKVLAERIGGIVMLRLNEYDDRALIRLYRIIYKRVERLLAGGLRYGWDMPTLRVLYPELAMAIIEIRTEGKKRGI
jgi:hypothetical protein